MANYSNLINSIKAVIKQNGTNDITGQLMQDALTTIVGTLGRFAQFAGVAIPSTNPGSPDQTVFYLATQVGTYVNFGGVTITGTRICAIHNINGAWELVVIITLGDGSAVEIDPVLDPDSLNPVENRAVYAECQAIRTLIASIAPQTAIKTSVLSASTANAITGETYVGKNIINVQCTITGVNAIMLTAAKQSGTAGSGVLRLYGTKFNTNDTVEEVIYEMNSATTLQDAIGINDSIDGSFVITYIE